MKKELRDEIVMAQEDPERAAELERKRERARIEERCP